VACLIFSALYTLSFAGPIPLPADWKGSNDAERGSWLAAVKRLKPAAESEPQLRRMFWNEAQLMLRLQVGVATYPKQFGIRLCIALQCTCTLQCNTTGMQQPDLPHTRIA
jgi:hypothetical protein